ncbi:MAG: single-stranded DNA-binding protein [Siphonobacter sp.]
MARTFNKVIVFGNLGRDPETRTLPSGAKVTEFSVATSESYSTRNGEKVEQTTWFRAEAWERLSDIASQYLKKGDQVYLEGRLRMEEYTDRDGNQRSALRIRVTDLNLMGSIRSEESLASGGLAQTATPVPAPRPAAPGATPSASQLAGNSDEDDLPF